MKQTCGCCEGIHKSTPAEIRNRPGLKALNYRAGTHATFLETMKARLSNLYLEDSEPRGMRLPVKARPLEALTMRDADDPAVALLDAWATVADVLTFYQERIANEGYLRTATERRSVLELARLIGYTLRPGVSASTFLAYTLDKDSVVTIPAGSRAQSVPGPGETLQSFETSVDLAARYEWNRLQPRLTYPLVPDRPENVDGQALYFKGIATNLKPNDAILVDFGNENEPELYRAVKVEPDSDHDRTKVTLQAWAKKSAAAKLQRRASVTFGRITRAERVREIVEHHSEAEEYCNLLKTRTGLRIAEQLKSLLDNLAGPETELVRAIEEEVLPKLREEHHSAEEGHFTRLEPWIQELISELEEVVAFAPSGEDEEAATDDVKETRRLSLPSSAAQAAPVKTDLDYILQSLEKPVSIPPANPLRLDRKVEEIFNPESDISTTILTALRPGLAQLLPTALKNQPGTPPLPAKVYAMRTRAAVFGNNAPLKNITDERTGRVIRQEEWTLVKTGASLKEAFNLRVKFFRRVVNGDDTNQFAFRSNIKIGAFAAADDPSSTTARDLVKGTFTFVYADENPVRGTVDIVTGPAGPGFATTGASMQPFTMEFKFPKRQITVTFDLSQPTGPTATSEGLDPSSFKFSFNVGGNEEAASSELRETGLELIVSGEASNPQPQATEQANVVALDAPYPQILPSVLDAPEAVESWAAIERPEPLIGSTSPIVISRIERVREVSKAEYGMALKTTQLTLEKFWLNPSTAGVGNEIDFLTNDFGDIRGTTVFAQSELLELAEAPIDPLENPICGSEIELDGLYGGLETGRWLIVTGERADITPYDPDKQENKRTENTRPAHVGHEGATGATIANAATANASAAKARFSVGQPATAPGGAQDEEEEKPPVIAGLKSTELVMLAGSRQGTNEDLPGDKTHTTLILASGLAYCYKRDTVTIYGNVAHATHGETRTEVLGSGDSSLALQTFTLKQPPLTFVSAPTVSGIDTTLKVRVNDVQWRESESLSGLGPKSRRFITRTDDDDKTRIIFGNGTEGARPATGIENITATYRNGIGRAGNVRAEQISLLATKPLGVKDVINPLPATGGADKEDRDTARRNAPMAVMSLDRLVSVQDYEDFARTFAGIGKASAARLSDGSRQVVFLTIAGADDIPIAETSDLYQNLRLALHKFGDPFQAVRIKKRQLKLLIISAGVRVHPDYLWEKVAPKVRASLLEEFSFARRELGQDVLLSEVISTMQAVEGVLFVDVDTLSWVDEGVTTEELEKLSERLKLENRVEARMAHPDASAETPDERIRPAELAILSPLVPDTLILKELKA